MNETIAFLYQQYLQCKGIVTDSRNATTDKLFFALRGANFDGNAFAAQALSQGAVLAVVDDAQYKQDDDRYVLVDDSLKVLQTLANHHRKQLTIPVIGITGSSGKTTVKELMRDVLRCNYKVVATEDNLNNHIGVPLTLLSIKPETEIAIIEMGANHKREIAALCEIAMPTYGLITKIGHMHIEGFGSFQGVIEGKRELYDYLFEHGGTVFVNSTDQLLHKLSSIFAESVSYPGAHDFYHCEYVTENPGVVYKDEDRRVITSQLLGKFHFFNIAAALCVAKYFKVDAEKAAQAIQVYRPNNNRSQLLQKRDTIILLDAYNANLETMKGAIEALHRIPATSRVLILGEMNELGAESERSHQELGYFTKQGVYKAVLLCGPKMLAAKETNPDATHFPDKAALVHHLKKQKFDHTAVLIKGSRHLQMETIVDAIGQ
ncbi:MAG: UDP-N-acetylmuramoyl-tripeptide--D-alanyl-D-alanine ligase [Bacteroidota bacterium]